MSAGLVSLPSEVIQVALNGLAVRIVCLEPTILAALEARFANFTRSSDLRADITLVCSADLAPHKSPSDGRVVYESQFATAVYSPAEDTLYAFHSHGATMRCDPAASSAEIAVGPSSVDRDWVVTRPLLTLALMELARRHRLFPLHAACLAHDGAGVLVCGPSGAGKSTLTVALLEAGLDFLGDDLVFLEPRGRTVRAFSFPEELGIAADAAEHLSRFPTDVDTSPAPGWPKARANLRRISPTATVVDSCEPRLVLLLSDGLGPGIVEEASADDALLELLPSTLLTEPATCAAHLHALATLANSATILRTAPRPDLAALSELVVGTLEPTTPTMG